MRRLPALLIPCSRSLCPGQHLRKLGVEFLQLRAHAVQQCLDAIDVLRLLGLHFLQVAMEMAPILVRGARHLHHAPHFFAGVMANQHRDQLGRIEPVRLAPPSPPIHLDRR
jgi:hypothetical protein